MIIGTGGHARDISDLLDDPDMKDSDVPVPYAYIGINDGRIRERLDAHEADFDGVVIGHNTTVGPDVYLGRHTHINGNCFVTRARLGDYCTVSPGVTISGDVVIGKRCQIGAGAVISNLVTLWDDVIVGAGAVIKPGSVLAAGTYVGNPVRLL